MAAPNAATQSDPASDAIACPWAMPPLAEASLEVVDPNPHAAIVCTAVASTTEEDPLAMPPADHKKGAKKNAWTSEEDIMLARVVEEHGTGQWAHVAAHLPGRMGRQCRERWFNHLAPEVKKGDWSQEEDELIVAYVREHGTRWSIIQKQLPGRSDNSIKNRSVFILHAPALIMSTQPLLYNDRASFLL